MPEDKVSLDMAEGAVQEENAKTVETKDAQGATAVQEECVEPKAEEPEEQPEEQVIDQKDKKKQKRKDALKAQVEQLKAEVEEKEDWLLRLAAEFDNYKRRTSRDFGDLIRNASENIITQLVPIVDDFERALDHAKTTDDFNSLHQGVEMILNHLKEVLRKEGLEPIEALGKPFDPNFHEALMQTEDNAYDSGVVVQETQRGYILNDKVIRPAKVIVNK